MSWPTTELARRLGLEAPIVQGPFGSGLSAVDLVVAVSEGGGLGSFGVHHLDREGIHEINRSIRERTDRAFALNLWIPFEDSENPAIGDADWSAANEAVRPYFEELGVAIPAKPTRFTPPYEEQVEAVLEARPAVFSFVFGIPEQAILRRCRELDIVTVGTVTTVDEAMAMQGAGVDVVVASGFEAGGHRISFLRSAEDSLMGTMALVPQVVDAVNLPVIAAGGIADGRGVAAALCLGAQAVQIGTAFLACDESAASGLHRAKLHSPEARYTALTRAFTGRLARGVCNRFIEEMASREAAIAPYPAQAWLTAQLKKASLVAGRGDLISLWSGQSAGLIRHRRAAELMRSLEAETATALRR